MVANGWTVLRFSPAEPPEVSEDGTQIKYATYEPRESIALTAEWIIKVREAVGRRVVLGIDYHHRLSVAEAASFCQMLPPHTLDFLEEPIRDETPQAYQTLRTMTDIPFAIGEEISSKWHFLPYIESGLTNFARIDICNIGGFTEAKLVAGWCEAHYIDLMPHNPLGPICTAASIHLAASVPNFDRLEDRNWDHFSQDEPNSGKHYFSDEMFPVQPTLEGDRYPIPTEPGLGVEFNEDMAGESFEFWEGPHLFRNDGSYTNW
jgi:galactonate dehydratase